MADDNADRSAPTDVPVECIDRVVIEVTAAVERVEAAPPPDPVTASPSTGAALDQRLRAALEDVIRNRNDGLKNVVLELLEGYARTRNRT